jgi:hypothetical protein
MTAIVALAVCAGSGARAENNPAGIKEAQAECRSALASDGLGHNSAWINTICSCPSVDRVITDHYVYEHPKPLNDVKRLRQACDGAAIGKPVASKERPAQPPTSRTLAAPALTGDMEDCQSGKLSASQTLESCRRAIRAMTPYPSGKTQIIDTFNGCEYGKKYPLFNGYDLVCQSYGYHYAFQPDVTIIDSSTAIIDGEKYSVSFQ